MTTDYEKIKVEIATILADASIVYTAKHIPSSYDPSLKDKDIFQGIKWKITFARGEVSMTTDFTQGIGHLPQELFTVKNFGSPDSIM